MRCVLTPYFLVNNAMAPFARLLLTMSAISASPNMTFTARPVMPILRLYISADKSCTAETSEWTLQRLKRAMGGVGRLGPF